MPPLTVNTLELPFAPALKMRITAADFRWKKDVAVAGLRWERHESEHAVRD